MPEYWSIEQAQANAELFAKEFSNRQILLYGLGNPTLNAPIGAEYEDRSEVPALRYRKIGNAANDWMKLINTQQASTEEVLLGVDEEKVISPARLTEKLSQFSSQLMGLPSNTANENPSTFQLSVVPIGGSIVQFTLPEPLSATMASIKLNSSIGDCQLEFIEGGEIGQLITLKRQSEFQLGISSTNQIKVSDSMVLNDIELLDNITLQKIGASTWVELARKKF